MFSHIKLYSTVLHPSLMAFLMTPRLVWTVEVPLKHIQGFLVPPTERKSLEKKETNLVESEGGEIEEKDEEKDENGEKDNDEEVEVVEKDFEEVRNTQRGFKAKKAVNEKAKKKNDGEKKYNLWVYICSPFQQRILEIRWQWACGGGSRCPCRSESGVKKLIHNKTHPLPSSAL